MRTRTILAALVPVILLGTLYAYSANYGRGGRGFFSPDTFEVKTQSEILFPILLLPAYRSSYEYKDESYQLVEYLRSKSYWTPIKTDDPSWLLMFRWNNLWRDGESGIYRQMNRDSAEWIDWSEDNHSLASVVWPHVLSVLRRGITGGYAETLMRYGRRSKSVEEFREYVNADPDLRAMGILVE